MSRASTVPSYRHHRPSGQAVVTICTAGGRRDVYLGAFNSPESRAEYARVVAEMATAFFPVVAPAAASRLTVDEVLLAFWDHVERHYRNADGTPTTEVQELRRSLVPLRKLYGQTAAADFGPRGLAAVRADMIGRGWCRTLVNLRVERIKRAFKWATSQELVPVTVYQALRTLTGLQKGRTEARESATVKPVDPAHVRATLPFLGMQLRTAVELQRLTGMRPGEACGLTLAEVERGGLLWVYRPADHKTAHRGKARVIPIGPKARAVLVAFLRRDGTPPDGFAHIDPNDPDQRDARLVMADAYEEGGRIRDAGLLRDVTKVVALVEGCVVDPVAPLFSPAESRAEWARAARANRKSKVQPSQTDRRAKKPKKVPGAVYRITAYGYAVRKAARKASVPHWHPNQLRHTFATEVRKSHGLEAAQAALGHSKADVTQVYAERDFALAAKVAAEIG